MNALAEAVVAPPLLSLLHSTGNMTLETDALDEQIGCMSLQKKCHNTNLHVGYCLSTLNDAELK